MHRPPFHVDISCRNAGRLNFIIPTTYVCCFLDARHSHIYSSDKTSLLPFRCLSSACSSNMFQSRTVNYYWDACHFHIMCSHSSLTLLMYLSITFILSLLRTFIDLLGFYFVFLSSCQLPWVPFHLAVLSPTFYLSGVLCLVCPLLFSLQQHFQFQSLYSFLRLVLCSTYFCLTFW